MVLITGTTSFVRFHLGRNVIADGFVEHGYDRMTIYSDLALKRGRHEMLMQGPNFTATEAMLKGLSLSETAADEFASDVIVHIAGQAGVRYSPDNTRSYIEFNVVGTLNEMEAARRLEVANLLMASMLSVFGMNTALPFRGTDAHLTIYFATKNAKESMGHSYAHLWNLPQGDVPFIWAEASLLQRLTDYQPKNRFPQRWRAIRRAISRVFRQMTLGASLPFQHCTTRARILLTVLAGAEGRRALSNRRYHGTTRVATQ